MIMKPDFVRGGLLGFLTGVAILAAWGRAEDMAMKIENFNFASGSVTMKGGTVIPTSADELRHAVTSTGGALKPKALDTEYDRGVICETQEQAERLAMLLDDNEDTAIATLNAEERDPSACAVETVAFVRGASLATARSKCPHVCGGRRASWSSASTAGAGSKASRRAPISCSSRSTSATRRHRADPCPTARVNATARCG